MLVIIFSAYVATILGQKISRKILFRQYEHVKDMASSRILDAKVGTKLGEHVFLVLERTYTNSLATILEQEMSKNIAQIPLGPKIEQK